MAEVRCPMCSKPNPENSVSCQYCQARIQPLTAPLGDPIHPGEEPTKKSTSELEPVLPEWLRKVRNPEAESDQPDASTDMPLDRFPEKPPSEQPVEEEPVDLLSRLTSQDADDDEEIPDWLANMRTGSGAPARQEPAQAAEPQVQADWLTDLRQDETPAEVSAASTPENEGGQIGGDLPGWLSDLEKESRKEEESLPWMADATGTESEGTPTGQAEESGDWLADLKSETSVPADFEPAPPSGQTDEIPGSTDLPDWLSGLTTESAASETLAEDQPEIAAGGLTDWFGQADEKAVDSAPAPEPGSDVDLPGWLSNLGAEAPGAVAAQASADSVELPDWFGQSAEQPESSAVPLQETGSLPDWLSGLDAESTAPAAPADEKPSAFDTTEGAVPDWMGQPAQEPAEMAPDTALTEDAGAVLPDWLAASMGEAPAPAQPAEQPAIPADLPDWLAGVTAGAAALTGEPEQAQVPLEPQQEADWQASLPAAESQPAEAVSPFMTESPAEVDSAAAVFLERASAEDVESAFSMDMPDWLSSVKPTEIPQAVETPAPVDEGDEISPASLPSWVQAMRPVESAAPDAAGAVQGEADVLTEGPLAGLSGVLPAGPAFVPGRKPQAYALKLQADDDQQANAALLERIVAGETEPVPLTSSELVLSVRVLRWVIFGILLLAVGLPLLARSRFTPVPSLFPDETLNARQAVIDLPENAAVLLIFGYEASLSGEMEAAASPLVDHLMLRGARLAILSTLPNGPLLAERFLARTQAGHNYQAGEHYINMGYLPGGPAGVFGFAQWPARAMPVLPALGGVPGWQSQVLQDIESLSDFDAVIVLTDSAEGGQVWVEQAGPFMAGKPMLMVVSAQAEPVLRPYFDSGQVKGMVSGLAGGAAYETVNRSPGMAIRYLDGFSMGLFVAVLMIVIGGLWSLISAWRFQRARAAGEV